MAFERLGGFLGKLGGIFGGQDTPIAKTETQESIAQEVPSDYEQMMGV